MGLDFSYPIPLFLLTYDIKRLNLKKRNNSLRMEEVMSPKSVFFMCVILIMTLCFSSSFALPNFDISNVTYDIESKLDDSQNLLKGQEIVSFITGEKTYSELWFYIYQHSHPTFFCLDSAFVNGKCSEFLIPELGNKDLLKIPLEDTISPHSSVTAKLYFSLRFGNDPDEYNAFRWVGDFYCGEFYPKLAEFDVEGAILPDTITAIPPVKNNKTLSCGTKSYLEETYLRVANYKLKTTLPSKFKIITSGEFNDSLINSNGTTTHNYKANKFNRIEWIAITNQELLTKDFDNLKVYCYYPPKSKSQAEEMMMNIKKIEEYYSEKFGPFPWTQLKILLMNMPSYIGGASGNDILFLPSGSGLIDKIMGSKMVLPHEVSHQWWGGAITCGTGSEGWFAEALASYSAELFCLKQTATSPRKSVSEDLNDKLALWLYIISARGDLDESLRGSGGG